MKRLGIEGFERLVPEEIPRAASMLLLVPPAEEKDQIAAQFLFEGLKAGGIAVALLSEAGIRDLSRRLGNLGFDADKAIGEGKLIPLDWFAAVTPRAGVEAGLPAVLAALTAAAGAGKGAPGLRFVVDLTLSLPDPLEPSDLDPVTVKIEEAVKASGALSLFFGPRAHGIGSSVQESFDLVLDLRPLKPSGFGLAVVTIGGTPLPRTHMVLGSSGGRLVLQDQKRAEARSASIECPVCKATIPAGAAECPVCGSPRPVRGPGESDVLDYIESLGARVGLQEAPIEGGEAPPPPPEPKPEPKPEVGRETAPAKPEPERERTGRTNGLKAGVGRTNGLAREGLRAPAGRTNGIRGRTNGMTNGLARKTGQGRVNGLALTITTTRKGMTNGLTNGNGFTNGLGSRRFVGESRGGAWRVYAIPLVAALLLITPLFLSPAPSSAASIGIDGNFSDWPTRVSLGTNATLPPSIDLTNVAVRVDSGRVYGYIETAAGSTILEGSGGYTDTLRMFVDADGNASSGYRAEGLGAEHMATITGIGGTVTTAVLYQFPPTADRDNFSAWQSVDSFDVATGKAQGDGNKLEFAFIQPPDVDPAASRFLFEGLAPDGREDIARTAVSPVSVRPIVQVSQVSVAPETVPGATSVLVNLQLESLQGDANLGSIRVVATGTYPTASLERARLEDRAAPGAAIATADSYANGFTFNLPPLAVTSQLRTLQVIVTLDTAASGTIGLVVPNEWDVRAQNAGVYLTTLPSLVDRAYVGAVPGGVRIDGAYGEWTSPVADPIGDPTTDGNPNVDLVAYDSLESGTAVGVYAKTAGSPLHGLLVAARNPAAPTEVSGSPAAPIPQPPVYGVDTIRAFIDSDGNPATGYPILVGADYMVEIVGRYGSPRTENVYRFTGPNGSAVWQWAPVAGAALDASIGTRQLELLATLPVAPSPQTRVVVDLRDWRGDYDRNDVATRDMTRSASGATMNAGLYTAELPDDLSASPVTVRGSGFQATWALSGVLAVNRTGTETPLTMSSGPVVTGDSSASYAMTIDGAPGTLRYAFGAQSVKEEVVLSAAPAALDGVAALHVRFDLGLSKGASLLTVTGLPATAGFGDPGDIAVIVDGQGRARFPRPFALDAGSRSISCDYVTPAPLVLDIACAADALRGASYPVRIDPSTTFTLNYTNSYYTAGAGENLGYSVAVGDFNGDGYADILAGAPFNDKNATDAGAAYIYLGPFTANVSTPNVILKGNGSANNQTGFAVAAGDVNADGKSDAIVTQIKWGPTLVFLGRTSWPAYVGTADKWAFPPSKIAPDFFGFSVAAGNFDGSSGDDIVIGRPYYPSATTANGRAYVYMSPLSANFTTPNFTLAPFNDTKGHFGYSLATGKIDSDGKDDIIVGETTVTSGSTVVGRISFFKGSNLTGSGTKTPDKSIIDHSQGAVFGYSVAVGRLNGDNYADVVVGSPAYSSNNGRAYVYLAKSDGTGLGQNQSVDLTISSQSAGEKFGAAVAIGDFFNDGVNGIAVTADNYGSGVGRLYAFDKPLTTDTSPDFTFTGVLVRSTYEALGHSVAGGKYANDPAYLLVVGGHHWSDASRNAVGRVVVAFIPEFPQVAVVAGLAGLLVVFIRRRRWDRRPRA